MWGNNLNKDISQRHLVFVLKGIRIIVNIFLLVSIMAILLPLSPAMPSIGLDPSWQLGIEYGVSRGFEIGKDLIFTFGPYVNIFSGTYHPKLDFLIMLTSIFLAFCYWLSIILLTEKIKWQYLLLGSLVFPYFALPARDVLLYSYAFIVSLNCFRLAYESNYNLSLDQRKRKFFKIILILFLLTPLGLLPLIKGTLILISGSSISICSVLFFYKRKRILSILTIVIPILGMIFFWEIIGQPLTGILDYFKNILPIVSGYSEAMAIDGGEEGMQEIILFLLSGIFLLYLIAKQKRFVRILKLFLLSLFFIFLFVSFKGGFVRHDGHRLIAGASLFFLAIMIPIIFKLDRVSALGIALLVLASIMINYRNFSYSVVTVKNTYERAWGGFLSRIQDGRRLKRDYYSALENIRKEVKIPKLTGTADIYSFNQTNLIASGNIWAPRPVFQSYSVYTRKLSEKNKEHLMGDNAPDNILFKIEPLDGRFPPLEDGASWQLLIQRYYPTHFDREYLYLKRRDLTLFKDLIPVSEGVFELGQAVEIPNAGAANPVFAEIEITPTIAGRFLGFLFKPTELQIEVELFNGSLKRYRMIANMAQAGILISPLISDTSQFAFLYGNEGSRKLNSVRRFTILPKYNKDYFWNKTFSVSFKQISDFTKVDIGFLKFNRFSDEFSNSNIVEKKCVGSIDYLDGASVTKIVNKVSGFVSIHGWIALGMEQNTETDEVYIALQDNNGYLYLKTQQLPRQDVVEIFNKPNLYNSGYKAVADISNLKEGLYTLRIMLKKEGNMYLCSRFKIPIEIKN